MPEPINHNKLKIVFFNLNQKLKEQKYSQFFYTGEKIVEREISFENQTKQKKQNKKPN